jgi:magnesium-transporting ATPase (P-type)
MFYLLPKPSKPETIRQACGWTCTGAGDTALSPDRHTRATVVQRYHFSSALRRMSAAVMLETDAGSQPDAAAGGEVLDGAKPHSGPVPFVVMKGAPEVVRNYLAEVRSVWFIVCIYAQRHGLAFLVEINARRFVAGGVCIGLLYCHFCCCCCCCCCCHQHSFVSKHPQPAVMLSLLRQM